MDEAPPVMPADLVKFRTGLFIEEILDLFWTHVVISGQKKTLNLLKFIIRLRISIPNKDNLQGSDQQS
jgi:hypothetical protein